MPDSPVQFYLVQVSRMSTSDDANLVASLSYIVAEEDLVRPGNTLLALSAEACEIHTRGCPLKNIRPMTEAEIAEYRINAD